MDFVCEGCGDPVVTHPRESGSRQMCYLCTFYSQTEMEVWKSFREAEKTTPWIRITPQLDMVLLASSIHHPRQSFFLSESDLLAGKCGMARIARPTRTRLLSALTRKGMQHNC